MRNKLLFTAALAISAVTTLAQSPREKAEQLAAEFSKTKNKEKEKNGVKTTTTVSIEAKADFQENTGNYAGKYEIQGMGHVIKLRQVNDGSWEGNYVKEVDGKEESLATFKNIRIIEALFNATLVSADGRESPFEGVFINRIDNGKKTSGLGIRQRLELSNGFSVDKAFYKKVE